MIFCEHRENLFRIKAVEVIDKNRRLAKPLTVKFSPKGFCPAGVGNCKMKSFRVNAVPVFGCDEMSERIFIVVCGNFRITGSAGSEEHEHRVVSAGSFLVSAEGTGEHGVIFVKIEPAFAASVDDDFRGEGRAVCGGSVNSFGGFAVCGADNSADSGGIEAVFKVVLKELVGCGNRNGSDFVESKNGEPELVMALENKHNLIAALDSKRFEIVCGSARFLLDIPEGKAAFGSVVGNMEHCKFIRLFSAKGINNIIGKVEMLLVLEADFGEKSVLILLGGDEFIENALSIIGTMRSIGHDCRFVSGSFLLRSENDRIENAVVSADGNHSVRS